MTTVSLSEELAYSGGMILMKIISIIVSIIVIPVWVVPVVRWEVVFEVSIIVVWRMLIWFVKLIAIMEGVIRRRGALELRRRRAIIIRCATLSYRLRVLRELLLVLLEWWLRCRLLWEVMRRIKCRWHVVNRSWWRNYWLSVIINHLSSRNYSSIRGYSVVWLRHKTGTRN